MFELSLGKHPIVLLWKGWLECCACLVCVVFTLTIFSLLVPWVNNPNPVLHIQGSSAGSCWTSLRFCASFCHQLSRDKHSIPRQGKPLIYMDYSNPASCKQNQKIVWLPNDSEMQTCCQKILAFVSFTLEQMHSGRELNFFILTLICRVLRLRNLFHKKRKKKETCFTIRTNMKMSL